MLLIIKNIYKKIEIHPFFYVITFLVLLTGNFNTFCLFMSLLMVHECGHIMAGLYFKWNIEKVVLFPFGALTVFQDHLNKPIKEEWVIVLLGPIFQCLFYRFLCSYSIPSLSSIHYGLLFFNLLPIIPLDGSKIVLLIYQVFFSYWSSYYFILCLSIIGLFSFFLTLKNIFVLYLILIILFTKIITLFQRRYQLFSKFLLERFLYSFSFPKRKTIIGGETKKMKRDTKHLFFIDGRYETEKEYLQKMFDFKGKKW